MYSLRSSCDDQLVWGHRICIVSEDTGKYDTLFLKTQTMLFVCMCACSGLCRNSYLKVSSVGIVM